MVDPDAVGLFLDFGADANSACHGTTEKYCFGGLLQEAVFHGHMDIAILLLDKGASDVNARGRWYGSALEIACLKGDSDAVQLLLDRGADANAPVFTLAPWFGTILELARRLLKLQELLEFLEYGPKINATSVYRRVNHLLTLSADEESWFGGLLQVAAWYGQTNITRLLLEHGADVNAHFGVCGNALQAACRKGHTDIVRLLLAHGTVINAQGKYGNALQAAFGYGHSYMTRLLLARWTDFGLPFKNGAASKRRGEVLPPKEYPFGHPSDDEFAREFAELLEMNKHGTDKEPSSREDKEDSMLPGNDDRSSTPPPPSMEKYEKTRSFEDEDNRSEAHLPPPEVARQSPESVNDLLGLKFHIDTVRLLLESGADVNSTCLGADGYWFGGILQAASWYGHMELVRVLLEHGADVNAIGGIYGGALAASSWQGHTEVVHLLLEWGADVNAECSGFYGSPLQAASINGHREVVSELLDNGADVNAQWQGRYYRTALEAAESNGHPATAHILRMKVAEATQQRGKAGSSSDSGAGAVTTAP
jgi:ankyrin repeat protein